jgi:ATP-dependent RNA helicase DeaD
VRRQFEADASPLTTGTLRDTHRRPEAWLLSLSGSQAMKEATRMTTADDARTETRPEESAPEQDFSTLGLGEAALRALTELGFSAPTPIQLQAIPLLLAGRDVIAQAPTGTGKTAAYGLPIVERLDEGELKPQALVVVPTRELAIQVAEALHALGKYREMVTVPIYGGQPYERQLRALARGVQVVVGTPGRLLDHMRRGTLDLSTVRLVVLDEADEMLNMGFIEDIEAILAELPAEHQSALFSATIPPRIARLAQQYLRTPEQISVIPRETTAPRVRQVYYEVPAAAKLDALTRILDLEEPESAIVFVRTRRDADILAEQLTGQGYVAQAIHGEIPQAQREHILQRFRAGHTQLLIATDVAARGLDIPDVSHVINYDLPLEPDAYVHRIGRTGRAGRSGEALALVTPRERRQLRLIEHATHRRLQPLRLPTPADVAARRRATFREDVLRILDTGQLDPFLALVQDLAGTHDPGELAAAAFKLAVQAREARRGSRGMAWVETLAEPAREEEPAPETAPAPQVGEALALPPRKRGRPSTRPVRLFLRVGRHDGIRPADVVGAITNEANISGQLIGDIDVYDTFTFVEVPAELASTIITALTQTTIHGRKLGATIARPDTEITRRGAGRGAPRRPAHEPSPRRERPQPGRTSTRRLPADGRRSPAGSRRSR